MLIRVLLSLFVFISAGMAHAKVYEGHILVNSKGERLFKEFGSKLKTYIKIQSNNSFAGSDIAKLVTGDYVVAKGRLLTGSFEVDNVDFVRLKNMVGIWENKTDGIQLDVSSENRLTLTRILNAKKVTKTYLYVLSPSEKLEWVLYLFDQYKPDGDPQQITVGIIVFNNLNASKLLRIAVYNSEKEDIEFQSNLILKKMKTF